MLKTSDLVLKEIYGICETKNPSKEQVNEYKMTKRQIYKKFTNLNKKELNAKNNKKAYVRNDVMTTIKRCRGEKTRGITAIDEFRKELMISDFEIRKYPEFEVKSKIGNIFKNQNPHEEYSVKIYEIGSYFKNIMKKNQADKNECKYILFRIDIYFSECFLAVEIDERGHTDRDLIFEEKRQKALEKKLGCKCIRINTSNAKNEYDLDYEVGNVQAFIDEFKNKKIKKLEKQLIKEKEMREKVEKEMREKLEKELKDKNKKLKNLTNNQVTNNFGKIIIKN